MIFPCEHTVAVVKKLDLDIIRLYYPREQFDAKKYRMIYMSEILASPALDLSEDDIMAPPMPISKPSPKKTKRIPSNGMN